MPDEIQTIAPPTPSIVVDNSSDVEGMGTYTAKFVAAFLGGPVGSRILAKIGVPLDPAATTVFIAMALHFIHDKLKKQFPASVWL